MILVVLDDARWDDYTARFTSGPRSGQRVMEQTVTRVKDKGITFTNCRGDCPVCAPTRQTILTGNTYPNHHMGASLSVNDYYPACREGYFATNPQSLPGNTYSSWYGPWEKDRALQAGLPSTPVPASSVPIGGKSNQRRLNNVQRGDSTDDLQAFTGSLPTFLSSAGVMCMFIGKYTNAFGGDCSIAAVNPGGYHNATQPELVTLYVPPGWDEWNVITGNGTDYGNADNDHYHVRTGVYSGPQGSNAADGEGSVGVEQVYDYDREISSITWAAGKATVVLAAPYPQMQVGDEVAIQNINPSGYVNTMAIITDVVNTTTFKYAVAVNPGGPGSQAGIPNQGYNGHMMCFPRNEFYTWKSAQIAVDMLSRRRDDEPWFLQLCPQMPHEGESTSGSTATESDAIERERRYMGTVDPNSANYWNGVAGGQSPVTVGSEAIDPANEAQWEQRQEMLATADDAIGKILDYCAGRGWSNITVMFSTDNGMQTGEQSAREGGPTSDVWDPGHGKLFVWEGSTRTPLWIRHPGWPENETDDTIVGEQDYLATILDFFSLDFPDLINHHAHTKRDGYSIVRLRNNPADPVHNRAFVVTNGRYLNMNPNGEAIIDKTYMKMTRTAGGNTNNMLFDLTPGNYTADYEKTDLSAAQPATTSALAARLDQLRYGRYDPVLNVNTCKTL